MTTADKSLSTITKGAALVFLGAVVGQGLQFLGRIMVARIGTESEFGIFSLVTIVVNVCTIGAVLGLEQGTPRMIAFARAQGEMAKVRHLMAASVQASLLASILFGLIIFALAGPISHGIFDELHMATPLRIMAFGIPFFTLIRVGVSILRGFDDVRGRVYFQDVLRNVFFALFLLPLLFASLSFNGVFFAFLGSLIIPCLMLFWYLHRRVTLPLGLASRPWANPAIRGLLAFSVPLLLVAWLQNAVMWMDTFMVGAIKTSTEAGLYGAAHPLAEFISMGALAVFVIYLPIVSALYAQGELAVIKRNYAILTKWLVMAILPLFLVIFLYAETVLKFLFGAEYGEAANALRILCLGFLIDNLTGPNGGTLIAMGRSQFMMWAILSTVIVNLGLNFALIPPMGIEGAAIGTVVALTTVNIIRNVKVYSLCRAIPLSWNLMKAGLASSGMIIGLHFALTHFVSVDWWMLPLLLIAFYGVCGTMTVTTHSLDKEDVAMLATIEKRSGMNLGPLKTIGRRFL